MAVSTFAQNDPRVNRLASLHRSLGLLLGCVLVVGIVLTSLGERRVDFWWQLREGQSILATHHLPAQPPAAFGLPSRPFVDEYGLYEITLALLDRLGGLGAIHAAFIAVYLAIFALPLLTVRAIRRDLLSATLLALAAIFLINRYEQRPELVGVLLLVILVAVLRHARDFSLTLLLRLGLIFALWTNVHSSYVIGGAALAIWLVDRVWLTRVCGRWKLRQAAATLAVAFAALLLNPYGVRRIAFTFSQENDIGSNVLSREMWPAWNQPPGVMVLLVITALALAAATLPRPRPSRWLIGLSLFLSLLTVWHFRHMSFLAVPLLYLYAERLPSSPASTRWLPARVLLLGLGCVAVLLFDGIAARRGYDDFTQGDAGHNRGYATGLLRGARPTAVLCHDAEGSFVSFAHPGIFPLIDSGQGRFADATKRFYFFTVQDPYAFNQALDGLPDVDAVIVTPPVEGWTLALMRRPDWRLASADAKGLLFVRDSAAARATTPFLGTSPLNSIEFGATRDAALREGDAVQAFCLSALDCPPAVSLALLDQTPVSAWSEAFFSFARVWVRGLAPNDIVRYFATRPPSANGLLREIILARMKPGQPLPPPGPSTLERLARVLTLLEWNDPGAAKDLFVRIRQPNVSPLYYTLRGRLDPRVAGEAPDAERWQDWNAGGQELFDQEAPVLDRRAAERVQSAGKQ